MSITPSLCRAARGLLKLSQSDTAKLAHVTGATIGGFEREEWVPTHNNLLAIRSALEVAGIEFLPSGLGVRLCVTPESEVTGGDAISPAQCRAARYMLRLSQEDLADAAGVGRSTIADYERGTRLPISESLRAMRHTLESSDVIFIEADGSGGPGVRLRK